MIYRDMAEPTNNQPTADSKSSLIAQSCEEIRAVASADELQTIQQIDALAETQDINLPFLRRLLEMPKDNAVKYLHAKAREAVEAVYGDKIFLRGLVEITSFCRNNCNYCGIRRSNNTLPRYRMTFDEIMACCQDGYKYGMRTFVLGGPTNVWATLSRKSVPGIPTAPSPSPWANARARATNGSSTWVPTVTCCVTRPPTRTTTTTCTPPRCRSKTACSACRR